MFRLIKQCFFTSLAFLTGVNSLNCVTMSNQKCKTRPQIVNVNGDVPLFFPYSIKISKCSGTCNNIKNPLAKLCVPDVAKNLNVNDTFTIPFPFCAKNFLVLLYYISSLFGFLYFLSWLKSSICTILSMVMDSINCFLISSLLRCFVFLLFHPC